MTGNRVKSRGFKARTGKMNPNKTVRWVKGQFLKEAVKKATIRID